MIEVTENHFDNEAAAARDIDATGQYKTQFTVPQVAGEAHWHRFDAVLYLLEGVLHLTDVTTGKVLEIRPGCKVSIPQGTLHAERSNGYRVLLSSSVPPEEFGDPVDVPPNEL